MLWPKLDVHNATAARSELALTETVETHLLGPLGTARHLKKIYGVHNNNGGLRRSRQAGSSPEQLQQQQAACQPQALLGVSWQQHTGPWRLGHMLMAGSLEAIAGMHPSMNTALLRGRWPAGGIV